MNNWFVCIKRNISHYGDHIDTNGNSYDVFGFENEEEAFEFGHECNCEFKILPAQEVYSWKIKED